VCYSVKRLWFFEGRFYRTGRSLFFLFFWVTRHIERDSASLGKVYVILQSVVSIELNFEKRRRGLMMRKKFDGTIFFWNRRVFFTSLRELRKVWTSKNQSANASGCCLISDDLFLLSVLLDFLAVSDFRLLACRFPPSLIESNNNFFGKLCSDSSRSWHIECSLDCSFLC